MDSYFKSYEDDIFFFLPTTSVSKEKTREALLRDRRNRPYDKDGEKEDATFGEVYCDTLTSHCVYECNSPIFKQLARIHLGTFELACIELRKHVSLDRHAM